MKTVTQFYRSFIKLYPKKYRNMFEKEMLITFEDMLRERKTQGAISNFIFSIFISFDTVRSIVNEYINVLVRMMTTKTLLGYLLVLLFGITAIVLLILITFFVGIFPYGFNEFIVGFAVLFFGLFFIVLAKLLKIIKTMHQRKGVIGKSEFAHLFLGVQIIICIVFVVGFIYAAYDMFNEEPPQFFTFNEKESSYIIEKSDNMYWVQYQTTGRNEFGSDLQILIAKSSKNLDSFIGKQVQLDGKFISTNKQCIMERCKELGGNWVGLDIKSIAHRE